MGLNFLFQKPQYEEDASAHTGCYVGSQNQPRESRKSATAGETPKYVVYTLFHW